MPSIKKETHTAQEAKQRRKIFAQNFYDAPRGRCERRRGGWMEGGTEWVSWAGVCRSSDCVVLLPFASCPLKWCKIYEPRPPFCAHFIEFYFLRQKWSAESRHCCCSCCCYCERCCCYCEWCCCCLCCCCCSSSCFVIYCLQLPNLFLCFCCKFTILFCGLFDAAGIPPSPFLPYSCTFRHLIDFFFLSSLLCVYHPPPTTLHFFLFGFMCASFRASIVQQLFLQHQKSTRGNARNKVM